MAIPLLIALILVNRQETFRRQVTDSLEVRVSQAIAQPTSASPSPICSPIPARACRRRPSTYPR